MSSPFDRIEAAASSYRAHCKCGCHQVCGDLPEDRDDPRAVCRGLRLPPREPLVEIVLEYRAC